MNKYIVSWNYLDDFKDEETGLIVGDLGQITNDYEDIEVNASNESEARLKAIKQIKQNVETGHNWIREQRKLKTDEAEQFSEMVLEFKLSNIRINNIEIKEEINK